MSSTSVDQQRPQRTWRRPSNGYMSMTEEVLATAPDSWLIAWAWHERSVIWLEQHREDDPHALFFSTTALLKSVPPDDRAAFDAEIGRHQAENAARDTPAEPLDTDPYALLVNEGRLAGRGLRMVKYAQRATMELRFAELLDHKEPTPPPPDAPRWTWRLYHLVRDLHEMFRPIDDDATHPATNTALIPDTRPVYHIPGLVPQYTFAELKAVAMASADGPRGRGWIDLPTETALWHTREKDAPLQIQYTVGPLVQWLGSAATHAALRAELPKMGLAANLALHTCVNSLLGPEPQATINLDDLVTASGMVPRSRAERIEMRSRVWHWLVVFSCWQAVGQRKGTYKDPDTHQVQDLRSESPLFHIDERSYPTGPQISLEEGRVPLQVTILRGSWLRRWAGNAQVVSYFGNVRKLTSLPGGQPSGAWAQAIGMALFQFWREESSRVAVVPVGENKKLTARFKPRTRRELLDLFPPDPTVDEILNGPHPRNALTYYKKAIALLKNAGVLGYYQEPPLPGGRQGWGQVWVKQEVIARPAHDDTQQVAVMAARAEAGRKARTRRKKMPA